jgi:chemotaxis protein MotB
MAEKKTPIIIKKKSGGHGAAHGGSWKVAYADFVTAMMAFFLLMWLLGSTSAPKKAAIADYFQQFSILEPGGFSVITGEFKGQVVQTPEHGGQQPPELPPENEIPADTMREKPSPGEKPGFEQERPTGKAPAPSDKAQNAQETTPPSPEQLQQALTTAIDSRLKELQDQVYVGPMENGVQIQVVDAQGRPLFQKGGVELTEVGKKALAAVTASIKNLPNKIAIEGHTDAYAFSGSRYTNWELSTQRASSARREMETQGLSSDRLVRVSGYASTLPLDSKDPYDPRNRRISVLVYDKPPVLEKPTLLDKATIKKDMSLPVPPQAPPVRNDLEQNGTDIHGTYRAPIQKP